MDRRRWFGHWLWLWAVGYAALVGGVVWAMFAARDAAITSLSTPEAVADWERWRADVAADRDRPAPVARRVPKSTEPPAVVLMRDNFGVLLAGAVFFSSLLFWISAWLATGMLRAAAHPTLDPPES